MQISNTFHVSNGGHAVTNLNKLRKVGKHNLRRYQQKIEDPIEVLIGSDNLVRDVAEVYDHEFSDALERYNAKQTRADRRIDDYLTHVSNSRTDVACEIIMQVGDSGFWGSCELEKRKTVALPILRAQLQELQEICPGFKIANATIHYNENKDGKAFSSPHLHVIGVPIAEGYKKGLEKQVCKTKVFTKKSLSLIQERLHEILVRESKNYDIFQGIEIKEIDKGRNYDIPKQSIEEYQVLKYESDRLDKKLKKAEKLVQPQVDAFERLSKNNVKDLPLEVREIEVKDGFAKSHKEKVLVSPQKDAEDLLQAFKDMQQVLLTHKAFNDELERYKRKCEQIRQEHLGDIEKAREIIDKSAQLIEKSAKCPEVSMPVLEKMNDLLNDEVAKMTIERHISNVLEDRGEDSFFAKQTAQNYVNNKFVKREIQDLAKDVNARLRHLAAKEQAKEIEKSTRAPKRHRERDIDFGPSL